MLFILQNPQLEVPHIIKIFTTGRIYFPMIDRINDLRLWVDPLDYSVSSEHDR